MPATPARAPVEQVERVDVQADGTAGDRPINEQRDRSLDHRTGFAVELRRATDHRGKCRRQNLLRGDVVNEQSQPGAQCLDRRQGRGESGRRLGEVLRFVAVDRLDQCVSRREVAIERADPHTGRLGDRFEAGLSPFLAEHRLGDLDQPIAVPPGIRP